MLRIALLLNGLCLELGQFTNGHSLKRKFPKLSSSSPFLDWLNYGFLFDGANFIIIFVSSRGSNDIMLDNRLH